MHANSVVSPMRTGKFYIQFLVLQSYKHVQYRPGMWATSSVMYHMLLQSIQYFQSRTITPQHKQLYSLQKATVI